MNSKEARSYVHLAGCECQGTTRKALDIVLSDSEKLEQIKQIVKDYDGTTPSMVKQFSEMQKVLEME